ncbi:MULTISPECIES: sugar ABC transporter permease [Thermoactinomyces]|jgi:arabinogalactan oligomer / maltooligosaccharide transport system permease protein|uniref:Sugar ABC transporter permease n=1 Tax=Thermoactinomyces daqus TaxID=1329516 RepID=A0A7W1XC71_9BACL|nr:MULTISPECIES: sugar ABC transporter permease [Thermoactinomyces]MBA4543926.1 sugar ABC transporter permease [Thermoactinomyces daqus]MBH8597439.1 sugar ABC transporter permease [Thermoactinomyces sp. CICC 10523]MBH8603000.1 sugar ABC transporter permease [Thermoactinomyces sp. CICC 10522]MBH8607152.1 sugar ABC transporter permease [Thermoactinomyces sp. CICC 10521]
MNSSKRQTYLRLLLSYLILIIMAVICIYPLLWVIGASFSPGDGIFSTSLVPKHATLAHYRWLFFNPNSQYPTWYWNTLKIALINAFVSVIITTGTAYVFSRYRFFGRKYGLVLFLTLQMFPSMMTMVAIYLLLNWIGLLDTHLGLLIFYAGTQIPFNTWLVKGYFDTIPYSLDEAARIDGAGHVTIFWKVIMPLAKPILAVMFLFNFMTPMTDFLLPQIILTSPDNQTLAVGLFSFINKDVGKQYTLFAAGSVLIAVPITVIFLSLQRYFISGLTAGANKG